jgi:UrcA family protein
MDARKVACVAAAAFIGALLIGAATNPVEAQTVGSHPVTVVAHATPNTRVVPYGDLALNTRDGRHMLAHRVGIAVSEVCPNFDDAIGPYDVAFCQASAWKGAEPQMKRALRGALSGQPLAMSIEITAANR